MIRQKIIEKIKKNKKSITLDKYINICLYNRDGYYKAKKPIGRVGDFVTSPEISQLFGDIIGAYIYYNWKKKYNSKFNLIELGPGNGTLMIDILNITKNFLSFKNSIDISLIETNKYLIKKQQQNINKSLGQYKINWHENLSKINTKPAFIIANEFFDCFSVKHFIKNKNKWFEKAVNYNPDEDNFFYENLTINNRNLLKKLNKIKSNKIYEYSKKREIYFDKICRFIKKSKGFIIIFDYGYFDSPKNFTLQSIYNHKQANPLDNPGKQDISTLVDFKNLIDIAKKHDLKIDNYSTQKEFLVMNGIIERKKTILKKCKHNQKRNIESGFKRLVNEDQMGSLYKCLIVSS